jgi:DNA-binding response OmpR family regulator
MDQKKRKILLVDDDIDLRELYADIFRSEGFDVFEASDGIEGLDIASKEVPDVIFTGIIMPRMDGFAMMESLKKTVMTSNIPVVISSHMGREDDQKKANELGAKDFIIKSYTKPAEVIERINSLFLDAGSMYVLSFDTDANDAPKLAKELNFTSQFQCFDCGAKMKIKLKLINPRDKVFEARIFCSECGFIAK